MLLSTLPTRPHSWRLSPFVAPKVEDGAGPQRRGPQRRGAGVGRNKFEFATTAGATYRLSRTNAPAGAEQTPMGANKHVYRPWVQ